jgi:hypothetical protein
MIREQGESVAAGEPARRDVTKKNAAISGGMIAALFKLGTCH